VARECDGASAASETVVGSSHAIDMSQPGPVYAHNVRKLTQEPSGSSGASSSARSMASMFSATGSIPSTDSVAESSVILTALK
jgi:hypothetical protein